jgi:hypothetical protein
LRLAQETIAKLEKQIQAKQVPMPDAMDVSEPKAMANDFDEGKFRARILELDKEIAVASKGVGAAWDVLKEALTKERSELQDEINKHKPAASRMFVVGKQIEAMGKQIAKAEKDVDDQKAVIKELQDVLGQAEQKVLDKKAKLLELQTQHADLARQSYVPPVPNDDGEAGQTVHALGLDTTKLGEVLRALGAGDRTDAIAHGVAQALPQVITNARLQPVGATRHHAGPELLDNESLADDEAPLVPIKEATEDVLRPYLAEAGQEVPTPLEEMRDAANRLCKLEQHAKQRKGPGFQAY